MTETDVAIEPFLGDDAEQEYTRAFEYNDRAVTYLAQLDYSIRTLQQRTPTETTNSGNSARIGEPTSTLKVKLPKLELLKFNGQQRHWQPFWEQIQQAVHHNEALTACDKFTYLRTSLTGEAAAAIVGLPSTSICYKDAVDILISRFGNEKRLIQDHMEKLLDFNLVPSAQDVRGLRGLYDNVQALSRGLKSLGEGNAQEQNEEGARARVPREQPAALTSLLQALKNNFKPSSSALLQQTDLRTPCFICKSKEHKTEECTSTVSLERKKTMLQKHGRCFRCTLVNHMSKNCRRRITCRHCRGRHASTMRDPKFKNGGKKNVAGTAPLQLKLTTETSDQRIVLLQTAEAWASGTKNKAMARVLFDGGSQRSFITEDLSRRLGCKVVGSERLAVGYFGGHNQEKNFRMVFITLQSKQNVHTYHLEALETSIISDQRLPQPDNNVVQELRQLNYAIAVIANDDNSNPIGILIGAEHYWDFVTGQVTKLNGNIKAIETSFGWTVHGPMSLSSTVLQHSQTVALRTSAITRNTENILRKFWDLEAIGVKQDESDSTNNSVLTSFKETITSNGERYERSHYGDKCVLGVETAFDAQVYFLLN
ncbi:uncharacterized protein LOC120844826 [Ixodes scapularis]|uniref:uncharacterized protein LOC120844826 n=1 Tax=Ixodes scapularis TaxID=6945 RepID=UPI001C38339C|nr:uncharacterized protein LOC120844826 [Ixodes scapularis]